MSIRRGAVFGTAYMFVITSCGGADQRNADTTAGAAAAGAPAATVDSTATASSPAGGQPASPASGAAQPATGRTWDVKMIGDAQGYRFDPMTVTIKKGDAVRWTVVSGPPHNVTFWSDSIPQGASAQLQSNMSQTMAPLSSPLESTIGATYTVSFAGVPAGTYKYYCTPHLALGMKAQVTVQ